MSVYGELAEIYARGHWVGFSEQVLASLPAVLSRYAVALRSALDLACGTGEFAVGLARQGIAATGVDRSPEMLAVARRRAHEGGVAVRFVQQDMRELDLADRFDLVTCLYDSLNYVLEEAELAEAFRRVRRLTRGLFLFDVNTLYGLATR